MNYVRHKALAATVVAFVALGGCASLPEDIVARPDVSLRDVKVTGLGFNGQTFLLTFDISNPNPFLLPVNHVRYSVRLDGQRFASGETPCDISIPASGSSEVSISVDLDLLATAPQLLSIVRDGARGAIPYELHGQLGLDLPLAPAVRFGKQGSISLNSGGF
jgi:LEA14-like dessication related protein